VFVLVLTSIQPERSLPLNRGLKEGTSVAAWSEPTRETKNVKRNKRGESVIFINVMHAYRARTPR
jgi:hypothetical protein